MPESPQRVVIGCPTHDDRLDTGCARAMYATPSQAHAISVVVTASSLIDQNCNSLWCSVLAQADKFDWFAMLHSDVAPERWWIDKLVAEAESSGADIVSAVVPIKRAEGLTSTAIATTDPNEWHPACRLTLRQLKHLPVTFDGAQAANAVRRLGYTGPPLADELWTNTGCMLVRLGFDWNPAEVFFQSESKIRVSDKGELEPVVMPEDWNFSRRAHKAGAKVVATRAVNLIHRGVSGYRNDVETGWETDREYEDVHRRGNVPALAAEIEGWTTPAELHWLRENMTGVVVEVGTYRGRSAAAMTRVKLLHCVDNWSSAISGKEGMRSGDADYRAFLDARERFEHRDRCLVLRESSIDAARQFKDGSLDAVFIDGAHEYEAVAADLKAWAPKVKKGGIVCGHDYEWPSVRAAVAELGGVSNPVGGIWMTVR